MGIGTESPSAQLDVVGTTQLKGYVTVNSQVGVGTDSPSGKISVAGKEITAVKGSNFTATDAYAAGYIRLGLCRMDTKGGLRLLRFVTQEFPDTLWHVDKIPLGLGLPPGTVKGVVLRTRTAVFSDGSVAASINLDSAQACVTPADTPVAQEWEDSTAVA